MRSALVISTLAGLALAAPRPQLIDLAGVEAAPDPTFYTPPYDVPSDVTDDTSDSTKRSAEVFKRDGDCAAQPAGSGPVSSPDTVEAFQANQGLQVRFLFVLWITLMKL